MVCLAVRRIDEYRHVAALLAVGEVCGIDELVFPAAVRPVALDCRLFANAAFNRLRRFVRRISILRPFARIRAHGLDEPERPCRRVCHGKSNPRIIVGEALALKMEEHHILPRRAALQDLWTLQHASALDVAAFLYRKCNALIRPIAQVRRRIDVDADLRRIAESSFDLVLAVPVRASAVLQPPTTVGVDGIRHCRARCDRRRKNNRREYCLHLCSPALTSYTGSSRVELTATAFCLRVLRNWTT